jgi:hypothetical protein
MIKNVVIVHAQPKQTTEADRLLELMKWRESNQTVKDLPKKIEIFRVFTAVEGWVFPKSNSPSVCIANGFFVNLLTGGTCELTFQTSETSEYLASDVFKASFQVEKDPQTIIFSPELNVNVSNHNMLQNVYITKRV